MRSIDDKPTAHSWLQIFRILSLYTPTKIRVQRGNVDNEEELQLLVKYQKCLVSKFKACEQEASTIRQSFRDKLVKELSLKCIPEMEDLPLEEVKDQLIYDLCGYLFLDCSECKSGMLTTVEARVVLASRICCFSVKRRTAICNREVFQLVEQIVSSQFENKCHVYIKDSYETVIDHICELKLSNPCCENHPEILPFLIILIYRFHGFIC